MKLLLLHQRFQTQQKMGLFYPSIVFNATDFILPHLVHVQWVLNRHNVSKQETLDNANHAYFYNLLDVGI